jgi:hypothetical protein
MSGPDHNLSRDELERERADVLPDREAMSLISTDPTQDALGAYGGQDYGASEQASGAGSAASDAAAEAESAGGGTDAAGSSSGGESTTSEDRSETITASDTASSET